MNLKLGPALKLCAHINALKDAWTANIPPLKEWIGVDLDQHEKKKKKKGNKDALPMFKLRQNIQRIMNPQTAVFPETTAKDFSSYASSC